MPVLVLRQESQTSGVQVQMNLPHRSTPLCARLAHGTEYEEVQEIAHDVTYSLRLVRNPWGVCCRERVEKDGVILDAYYPVACQES
jgi:hypothetical protein